VIDMFRRIQRLVLLAFLPSLAHAQTANSYTQSNLISDGSVKAQQTDTQLINPWGVAIGQQTPFWINTAGTGLSEIYDTGANKQFVVTIPPAGGSGKIGSPTGIVFNPSTTDFALPQGSAAFFIFDALDGTISAWNPSVTNAALVVNNSASGAAYTGIAIVNNGTANFLLAADISKNKIDVFDSKFAPAVLSENFTDPSIPSGFAPFNVHVINNQVFVMYAQQNPAGGPPTTGAAAGYVSVFDNNGKFVARAISGGNLNAPWGLALAPASFGAFGGDLLVGNFGDGTINAYDPTSFALKGQLQDSTGKPIQNGNLWEILFGSNGTGDPNTLYFSAGVNNEKGGLFGAITATAAPAKGDFTVNVAQSALTVTQGGSATAQVSVSPSNGFASPVTFTVSGLPNGATFAFSPTSVTPAAGANASTTLTITAGTYTTPPPNPYSVSRLHRGPANQLVALGTLGPIGFAALFPLVRSRKKLLKSLWMGGGTLSLLFSLVFLSGCSGTKSAPNPNPVSTGTSTVTVTATSGSLAHTTTLSLTIQ
jgi:uncharacterized protein (TIGR03118 family)